MREELERLRAEVRRLRDELAAARRAREDILEAIAHDLRGPIGSIRLYAESRLLGSPAPVGSASEATDELSAIRRTAERTLWLIEDLLDFSALESGRLPIAPGPCSVGSVVRAVVQALARSAGERGVVVETRLAPGDPVVHADGERVVQALTNLVSHAIQATSAGGSVAVGTEAQEAGVTFHVRYAAGLGPENLASIFAHEWGGGIRRYRGAGLRLGISRRIVEAHGGRIGVDSPGGGTTLVSFTLPRAPP